ncbi:hypothetical protein Glove_21g168 [Diversispora epigaea]|uniref:Uncharacterized protein n=1 Tax=Diversispora epigaea TaxID=1348612 RepID=A0A397JWI3_9GLOM|nr:hypothetical protein Glove_21g168 [Diversispora epigaea]
MAYSVFNKRRCIISSNQNIANTSDSSTSNMMVMNKNNAFPQILDDYVNQSQSQQNTPPQQRNLILSQQQIIKNNLY